MKAALFVEGRVVLGSSHLDAFEQLSPDQQNSQLVSGFFDCKTCEFITDIPTDHFYEKEIYIIRHGQIAENNKSVDPDLTEFGIKQIEEIASFLKNRQLEKYQCFCSPMLRCLRTAEIIGKNLSLKFKPTDDLKDWNANTESETIFNARIKKILQNLPSKTIVVTHYGVVSNIIRFALCAEKADQVIAQGITTASITHINNQTFKRLR